MKPGLQRLLVHFRRRDASGDALRLGERRPHQQHEDPDRGDEEQAELDAPPEADLAGAIAEQAADDHPGRPPGVQDVESVHFVPRVDGGRERVDDRLRAAPPEPVDEHANADDGGRARAGGQPVGPDDEQRPDDVAEAAHPGHVPHADRVDHGAAEEHPEREPQEGVAEHVAHHRRRRQRVDRVEELRLEVARDARAQCEAHAGRREAETTEDEQLADVDSGVGSRRPNRRWNCVCRLHESPLRCWMNSGQQNGWFRKVQRRSGRHRLLHGRFAVRSTQYGRRRPFPRFRRNSGPTLPHSGLEATAT